MNTIDTQVEELIKRMSREKQFENQGYTAFVDLKTGTTRKSYLPMDIIRSFIGGRGVNMFLLANLLDPETSPLDPSTPLIYGSGLLSGIIPSSSRGNITGWSPESGIILDANAGDEFASYLKMCGFDHLVLYNISDSPVLMIIEKGEIRFEDAAKWWGMNNLQLRSEIETCYKGKLGRDLSMLNVTSPGEKGCVTAGVMAGIKAIHARGGSGAKMGSMKLKGILLINRNRRKFTYADKESATGLNRKIIEEVKNTGVYKVLSTVGTPFLYKVSRKIWAVGTKNNSETCFSDSLDSENLDEYRTGMNGCYKCSVRCRPWMDITSARERSPVSDMIKLANEMGFHGESYLEGDGPEYVTVGKFGSNIGVDDPAAVIYLNNILNDLGLDSSGTGGAIAWAMECFEKGLISEKDTGFKLGWGDPVTVARMLFLMSKGEGFGKVLAAGSRAVEKGFYPEEALKYRMTIKNLMQSDPHDTRIIKALALGVAVSTRGFDHLRNRPALEVNARINDDPEYKKELYGGDVDGTPNSYKGKEYTVKMCDEVYAVGDSLGACRFTTKYFNSPNLPEFNTWSQQIKNIHGIEISPEELNAVGKNIRDLERMINYSLGIRKSDDTLPERWMSEPVKGGPYEGEFIHREEFNEMLDRYYRLCMLNEEGLPVAGVRGELNRLVFGFNIDVVINPAITGRVPEGRITITREIESMDDLYNEVDGMYPGLKDILGKPEVSFSLNGKMVLSGLESLKFSNGDRIEFLVAMSGG